MWALFLSWETNEQLSVNEAARENLSPVPFLNYYHALKAVPTLWHMAQQTSRSNVFILSASAAIHLLTRSAIVVMTVIGEKELLHTDTSRLTWTYWKGYNLISYLQ